MSTYAWALVTPAPLTVPGVAVPTAAAPVPAPSPAAVAATTTLINDPDIRPSLSAHRETDAFTGLVRGLKEYLMTAQLDVPGGRQRSLRNMIETWAEPEKDGEYPALVIKPYGPARYDAKSLTPNLQSKLADGRYVVEPSELTATLRVELHAIDAKDRYTISSVIEDLLQPVLWMAGFKLMLPHYHGQFAVYDPAEVEYSDDERTAMQRLSLLTWTVRAHVSQVRVASNPDLRAVRLVTTYDT